MERKTDQEIKDQQNNELEEERRARSERLGHDIRRVSTRRKPGRHQNMFDALK